MTPTLGSASQGPTGPPQGGNPSLPPAIAALLASNRGVAGGLQAQPASQSPQQQQQQSQYMGYEPGRSAQSSPSMPSQSNYQPQQQSQQQHSSASSQSGNAAAPAQVQALLDMLVSAVLVRHRHVCDRGSRRVRRVCRLDRTQRMGDEAES